MREDNKKITSKEHFRRMVGKPVNRELHPDWLDVSVTKRFLKDVDRCESRGWNMQKLFDTVNILRKQKKIPDSLLNHDLSGNMQGYMECHVAPDWVLVYIVSKKSLMLTAVMTGTHRDCNVGDSFIID